MEQAYTRPKRRRRVASGWKSSSTPSAKKGVVLLPCRWVIEHSFGWAARFRRLIKDYERLALR